MIISNHFVKYYISHQIKFKRFSVFLDYSNNMGFKENLREEMDFQDIKPKELSDKTGISVNTLRNYINNHDALPNIDSAVKIAKVLNTTVEELVEGRKNKAEFQKSDMAGKFLSIFTKISENDQKSVIALLEEMKRH